MLLSLKDATSNKIGDYLSWLASAMSIKTLQNKILLVPIKPSDIKEFMSSKFGKADGVIVDSPRNDDTAKVYMRVNFLRDAYKKIEGTESWFVIADCAGIKSVTLKEIISSILYFNTEKVEQAKTALGEAGINPDLELYIVPEDFSIIDF